jgi:hypothetical protein
LAWAKITPAGRRASSRPSRMLIRLLILFLPAAAEDENPGPDDDNGHKAEEQGLIPGETFGVEGGR